MPKYCTECGALVPDLPVHNSPRHPPYSLTLGQLEVMASLATGATQQRTAGRLSLSRAAVASRVKRVLIVTRSRSTTEAVSKLVAAGQLERLPDGRVKIHPFVSEV